MIKRFFCVGVLACALAWSVQVFGNVTIMLSDFNSNTYANGISLAENAAMTWAVNAIRRMHGDIVFNSGSSLVLNNNLYLGSKSTLSGNPITVGSKVESFFENTKTIYLGGNQTFADKTINISTPVIIDGEGNTVVLGGTTKFVFDGEASGSVLTLRNMTLRLSAAGQVFEGMDVALENVAIECDEDAILFNENGPRVMTIKGAVAVQASGGKRLTLFGTSDAGSAVNIASGGILRITPKAVVEISASTAKPVIFNSGTISLDKCVFYTGQKGLTVSDGTVNIVGAVKVFNQKFGGTVNVDVDKALTFGEDVMLNYQRGYIDPVGLVVVR